MKFFKYITVAALALMATACSDDDVNFNTASDVTVSFAKADYTVNEGDDGANLVNFPLELTGKANGQVVVTVAAKPVAGIPADAKTDDYYYLTGDKYIIPEGETSVNVEVSIVGNTEENDDRSFELEIVNVEGAVAGTTPVTVVTIPDDDKVIPVEWKSLGMVQYTDAFITRGLFTDLNTTAPYQVELQESGDTPGLYRLIAPYGEAFKTAVEKANPDMQLGPGNYDSQNQYNIEIHAENPGKVYIMPQRTGVVFNSSLGEFAVCNDAGFEMAYNGATLEDDLFFGIFKDGVIQIPQDNGIALALGSGGAYYGNHYNNVNLVVMPGVVLGDYSVSAEYMGAFTGADDAMKAIADFTFGADVEVAKAGIVAGKDDAALIAAIKDGSYEAVEITPSSSNVTAFPIDGPGNYVIAVVTYDEGGEAMEQASVTFTVKGVADDSASWRTFCYADYLDGWFLPAVGEDPAEWIYAVEIQQNINNSGLIRVKNLYGPDTPLAQLNDNQDDTYVQIDLTDVDCILMAPQYSGFTSVRMGVGDLMIGNMEGYAVENGIDNATIKAKGWNTTTFKSNVLTFPEPLMGCEVTGNEFGYTWGREGEPIQPSVFTFTANSVRHKMKAAKKIARAHRNAGVNYMVRGIMSIDNVNVKASHKTSRRVR